MLRSKMFRGIKRLDEAAINDPPFAWGETGLGVAILQAALIALGYKLPYSVRKATKAPDGILGDETFAAIKAFQAAHKPLVADGIAGRMTIRAMDRLLPPALPPVPVTKPPKPKGPPQRPPPVGAKPPPPGSAVPPPVGDRPPPPEPLPMLPESEFYTEGVHDPVPAPDKGAGAWRSVPVTLRSAAIKLAINATPAFYGATLVGIGVNASRHLVHYFGGSGRDYKIDLEAMFKDNAFVRKNVLEFELDCLADYIDSCPPGTWAITCKQVIQNGYTYNTKEHSKDWYFAVGGFGVWTKARARIPERGKIHADIELKFFDRYNWDGGKKVEIAGITVTDEFMGDFHREGLAKEFNCVGAVKRRMSWERFSRIPPGYAF
jgi:hypothetical protein